MLPYVMHVCYGLADAGCDCKSASGVGLLITTSKRKNKNSQEETAREVGILTS